MNKMEVVEGMRFIRDAKVMYLKFLE